jgi:deazaflavin-dependent oxidoreductase (nitroreductase family)
VGGAFSGTPIILVHHIGARSGSEHVTPLAYNAQGDGRYLIVASNGGAPNHPGWYYNLKAIPRIEVEVGTERFTALATELTDAGRDRMWSKLVAAWPALSEFQSRTRREIPLFLLTRVGPTASS